jgi:dolichol-phosphate mannosyltransferase
MRDLILVMPVYNECGIIGQVVRDWHAHLTALGIDFEIWSYNDGSKDNTKNVLDDACKELPRLRAFHKANSGHGPTILRGYREASRAAKWIFQIDSDGEMGPELFDDFWRAREDYDFLLGRRDGRGGPLARQTISLISRLTVRSCYGKTVWDVNSPYRLMRSAGFASLFSRIPEETFAPNLIVSGFVGARRLRFIERPVPYKFRTTGEVSIKKWKLLKAAAKSFGQTFWFSRNIAAREG